MKIVQLGHNHSCAMCGRCCRGWEIDVDPETASKIDDHCWGPNIPKEKFKKVEGKILLAKEGEDCVFLKENKCMIHSTMSEECKPITCQMFPHTFVKTPEGMIVGLSFACPQVAANMGTPAKEDRNVGEIVEKAAQHKKTIQAKPVLYGKELTWGEYKLLEKCLESPPNGKTRLNMRLLSAHKIIKDASNNLNDLEGYFKRAINAKLSDDETTNPSPEKRRNMRGMILAIHALKRGGDMFEAVKTYVKERTNDATETADDESLERYIKHMIERKDLITRGDIADNIDVIIIAYATTRWLAQSKATKKGLKKPTKDDFTEAIIEVEITTTTQGRTYQTTMKNNIMNPLIGYYLKDPEYARILLGN